MRFLRWLLRPFLRRETYAWDWPGLPCETCRSYLRGWGGSHGPSARYCCRGCRQIAVKMKREGRWDRYR